jgi:hypothetical protein
MTGRRDFFSELHFFDDSGTTPPLITLGDNKQHVPATGWGTTDTIEHGIRVRRISYFLPALESVTLLSIKRHTSFRGCAFHAEANDAVLAYPNHVCSVTNAFEYTIDTRPTSPSEKDMIIALDETTAETCDTASTTHQLIQTKLSPYLSTNKALDFTKHITLTPTTPCSSPSNSTPLPSPSSPVHFNIQCPTDTTIPPGFAFTTPLGFHTKCPLDLNPILTPSTSTFQVTFLSSLCGSLATITNTSDSPLSLTTSTILGTIHFEHSNTPLRRPHVPTPSPTPEHQHQRRSMYRLENNQFIFHDKPSNRNGKAKRIHIPTAPPIDLSTDPPPIPDQTPPSHPTPCPPSHVPSNSPDLVSMSNDRLLRSIGFLSSPKLHKALTTASLPTIRIEHVDRNPTLAPGEIASLRAADRTTEPSPLPSKAGDLYHCDIGFGPTRSIGRAF